MTCEGCAVDDGPHLAGDQRVSGRRRPSEGVLLTGFSLSWAAPLCVALPMPAVLRLVVVLLFAVIVPGAAVVSRLGFEDRVVEWALTVTASLVICAGASVLMAWTEWWHPRGLFLGLAAACAVALWLELRGRWRTTPSPTQARR
jgi:hypothetical protein